MGRSENTCPSVQTNGVLVLLKADPEICPFAGTANNEVFSFSQDFYIQNLLCLKDVWCICSVSNCI